MEIMRGQIYFVYLDPAFGKEIGGYKMRPVVVLSINDINRLRVVTVVPGTSTRYNPNFKNLVMVSTSSDNGLKYDTTFSCNQLRSIDSGRFSGKLIGRLSSKDLGKIEESVKHVLGLDVQRRT